MELRHYLRLLWKWLWLIVLSTGIAAGSSYLATRSMPRIFESSATLGVGLQTIQNPNASGADVYTAEQLAQTYALIAGYQPILQGTVDALGLQGDWQSLQGQVNASVVPGTQLLRISVMDTDPERAAALANEVARQLILHSPTGSTDSDQQQHRQFVEQQVTDLRAKIEAAQAKIADLNKSLGEAFSARQIQDLQGQIDVMQNQITNWQANYAQLLNTLGDNSPNYLTLMEPALASNSPISPRTTNNMMLAAAVGLILAVGAALLLEYLDDTIKTSDDVESALKLVPLGSLIRMAGRGYEGKLITAEHPRSPISEVYRVMRTNLQYSTLDKPARTLLVTSASPVEGKSVTAANLAVVLAQAGLRTVLVDSDLRRPSLHKIFRLPNQHGLSNALLQPEASLNGHVQPTELENLHVLTSGPIPPNPTELLGSRKMQALLEHLKGESDVVVLDSPPALVVTDANVLASQVDGVVLVTDAGRTRRDVAERACDTLRKVGGNILGAVVNRVPVRTSGTHYYYYYYSRDGSRQRRKRKGKRQS